MRLPEGLLTRAFTKTIATVGPASRDPQMLYEMARRGVDVFRLNMAHGNHRDHEETIQAIREISARLNLPIGVLVDLAGPKIRLGQLVDDPTVCEEGAIYQFVRGDVASRADQLVCTFDKLLDELAIGDRVMLADGTVRMVVVDKQPEVVRCRVENGGPIRSRQGVNLPGANLSLRAITDVDRDNAAWAARHDVDFVGLSFVRRASELQELQEILRSHDSAAMVVAKIEKGEALADLEEIVQAADAVMVARGDLGVEIDIAEIAVVQKRIIDTCRQFARPVIVATEMLDSMQRSRNPTRAEATDVANAILDGADACMLSGETAIGEFPCDAVEMMNRIMIATESSREYRPPTIAPSEELQGVHPVTLSVVHGTSAIVEQLAADMVVVATRSGATARIRSQQRDSRPTIAVSDSARTLRQMCLMWGIIPVPAAPANDPPALRRFVDAWGIRNDVLHPGNLVASITGTGIVSDAHNSVVVHEVERR